MPDSGGGAMHMVTDIVSIKTAIIHLASRLESEAKTTEQWASLARNRDLPEVSVRLEQVAAALKEAFVHAEAAIERAREAQENVGVSDDGNENHNHEH